MSKQNPPLLTQGELFANDYAIPTNAAIEHSVQNTLNPDSQKTANNEHVATESSSLNIHNLSALLNPKSKMYQLTKEINWQQLERTLSTQYQHNGKSYKVRTLLAMVAINEQNSQNYQLTLALWLENPYWQFFCGMHYFETKLPCDIAVLKSFSEYVKKEHAGILEDLNKQLSVNNSSILPLSQSLNKAPYKKAQTLKRGTSKYPTTPILQPVFIKWYQDYLFYVYFLLAIGFWVIYALIFPATWPNKVLTWKQWEVFFYLVIAYPILEEIVFRGGLQTWLRKYSWAQGTSMHISVSNVLVSVLFSSLHLIIRPDDQSAYGIIIPSLVFGLFRDRHKHIISCTLLHVFYNMGFFFLIILDSIV